MANDNKRKFFSIIVDGIALVPKENHGILAKYARLFSSASKGAVTDKF